LTDALVACATDDISPQQLQEWSHSCRRGWVQWRIWFTSDLSSDKRWSLSYTGYQNWQPNSQQ